MAEARSAIHALDVKQVIWSVPVRNEFDIHYAEGGFIIYIPHPRMWLKNLIVNMKSGWRTFKSTMWPIPPLIASFIIAAFSLFVLSEPSSSWFRSGPVAEALWSLDSAIFFTSSLPRLFRIIYLAWLISAIFLFSTSMCQRLLCRVVMSYKGWLYDPPNKMSFATKIWGVLMKVFVIGLTSKWNKPSTYAFSSSLPRLPVPRLKDTVEKLTKSVRGILNDKELKALKDSGDDFLRGAGPKLQRMLVLKSWFSSNYVSDWWLTHVYLRGRGSLMINSNYYGLACNNYTPTKKQSARAANIMWYSMKWAENLRNESEPPQLIRGLIPLCMEQYRLCMSTTRVPRRDIDVLKNYSFEESHHVVVLCKGIYYVLHPFVNGREDQLLSPLQLQTQIEWIMEDASDRLKGSLKSTRSRSHSNVELAEAEHNVAVLTSLPRTEWATAREEYFSTGVNKASLSLIEKAMYVMVLDDASPSSWTEYGKLGIHGRNGTDRWFDKSFNVLIYANGQATVHAEHSWGDAPATAHMWEWILSGEIQEKNYDINGSSLMKLDRECKALPLTPPKRLEWAFLPQTVELIQNSVASSALAAANFDLVVSQFTSFGKRKVKLLKIAPDAFLQASLLLAYFRDSNGIFPCTYESSMTRLFQQGRTETIRSCSLEMTSFVRGFEDEKMSKEEKRKLLLTAASYHKDITSESMDGHGIDRHLFALYVVSVGMGVDAPFLKQALSMPWLLSTSQLPQRQTTRWNSEEWLKENLGIDPNDLCSPSGGFGPVSEEGYGVSYMVPNEDSFYFHVSSKKECKGTNSQRYTNNIHKAMNDIMSICVESSTKEKKN